MLRPYLYAVADIPAVPADTPAFKGLHNSFAVDSAVAAGRPNKRLKDHEPADEDQQTPSKPSTTRAAVVAPASSSLGGQMELEMGDMPLEEQPADDPYTYRYAEEDEELESILVGLNSQEQNNATVSAACGDQ